MRRSATARAGSGGAAAGTTAAEIDTAIQLEPVHMKIDFNGLGAIQELLVDNILETAHIKFLVIAGRLIQSHGQAGTTSAALVQKNPDGLDLFALEIGRDLLGGRRGYFKHGVLLTQSSSPEGEMMATHGSRIVAEANHNRRRCQIWTSVPQCATSRFGYPIP